MECASRTAPRILGNRARDRRTRSEGDEILLDLDPFGRSERTRNRRSGLT